MKGFNDLATVRPDIASEWNDSKNQDLKPNEVTSHSGKKVWWKCLKGHEWQATIASRTDGCGCPICSNRKVKKGYNDLETLYPELAKEWHPDKNDALKPSQITPGSSIKVWWKCPQGHEWIAPISNRSHGANCPKCSHPHERKTNEEFLNDLKRIDSTVIPLEPYIDTKTKIKVRCKTCGYEWLITPGSILNAPKRCPQCWKKRQGKDRLKTDEDFKRDLYAINPTITPLEHYTNSKHKILSANYAATSGRRLLIAFCEETDAQDATILKRPMSSSAYMKPCRFGWEMARLSLEIEALLEKSWIYTSPKTGSQ